MKYPVRDIGFVLFSLLLITGAAFASEYSYSDNAVPQVKAAVITCKGDIDYGLYKSIKRRTKIAIDDGATYLIYDIGTYGGLLKSADDISKFFILEVPRLNSKAHTVAYVTTEAISAGSLISVSCRDIIMLKNTTIGDCAPITIGGQLEGVTDQYEFFQGTALPEDSNTYDLGKKELVDSSDEILTLTAAKAHEYGIARAVVNDVNEALGFLAQRDNVKFAGPPIMLNTTWSEELARWLNSTTVMAVLVGLALLGVYIELTTPGLGLPGLLAVICFVLIIGSKYISGLANWIEIVLFVSGVILLLVEIFVIPGFGITGIAGIVLILVGLFGMLIKNAPNEVPWPTSPTEWRDFNHGIMAISVGLGAFIVLAWLASKYLPKIPFLSGLMLVPDVSKSEGVMPINMTRPTENETENLYVGDIGEVVSTLRPTGKAKFGDAIVDVVAEGDFINRGVKVEITGIHGNRVVVKAIF
ncbi:MAG: NfeD family protein [Sedimentisphaerales bacterium]